MKKPLFITAILFIVLMIFLLLRYGPVLLAERGDYGLAIRHFTQAIDSGELSHEELSIAYFNRGNAWKSKGKYNKAIADYTKAIEIDPNFSDAYYNRAVAWKSKGRWYYKKAAADYKKAIAAYKNDARANLNTAITKLTKIIELDPKNAKAYYDRGITWREMGEYEKAIADYTKAIQINPEYAKAYNSRGLAWKKQGNYDKAIADYTKAIEINPRDPIFYNNRGFAWEDKGDYERAIADCTKAIEIDQNYAEAYNKLAWLKATCPDGTYRDGVQTVELAKKAVELKETYYTLGTLAAAYAEAGRFQDAIKTQKRAIEKHKKEGYMKHMTEYKERLASYKAGKPWRDK